MTKWYQGGRPWNKYEYNVEKYLSYIVAMQV
jgi:hypothetical protein